MKLVNGVVACLLALSLSSCFIGAKRQVFSRNDLSPMSKPRLQGMLQEYPNIVSAEPLPDNTVKVSYRKDGKTDECDVGFIYLEEPKGYLLLTNISPNCTLWTSSSNFVLPYAYIVVANVGVEKITNRILREDVQRTTQTVVWPYGLKKRFDHEEFTYLLKKYNLDGFNLGESDELTLAIVEAFGGKLEGYDKEIYIFTNDKLEKDQILGFFRDGIKYDFFRPKVW